jgi:hypothetical protein
MEQIQQHEWAHYTSSPLLTKIKCIHCKIKKITSRLDGTFIYIDRPGNHFENEPACIIRQLNAPNNDKEAM